MNNEMPFTEKNLKDWAAEEGSARNESDEGGH